MRRSDLEGWGVNLRGQLVGLISTKDNKEDVFRSVLGINTGDRNAFKGMNIAELLDAKKDIPEPPGWDLRHLNMEEEVMADNLRKKLNNLEILLLTDNLLNQYEEGWVPPDLLPGSIAETRPSGAPRPGK